MVSFRPFESVTSPISAPVEPVTGPSVRPAPAGAARGPAAARVLCRLAALLAALLTAAAAPAGAQVDPWEDLVAAFEASDRVSPPPRGEVVFIGSSSIRYWDTTASFPDLRIINRGFWLDGRGFELADAVRYVDRMVVAYRPRVVVVYAGDNDVSGGRLSEQVVVEAERFVTRVRAALPDAYIVFIGVKPSIARWRQVDRMRAVNAMLRAFCERDDRVAYIDVDSAMLGWDETPRPELFIGDGLHLSAEGYRLWTTLVRPFLTPPAMAPGSAAAR